VKTIELIARSLCLADGFSPDLPVLKYHAPLGPRGHTVIEGNETVQAWMLYIDQAALVKANLDAAKTVENDEPEEEEPPPEEPPSEIPYDWRIKYGLARNPAMHGLPPK
jgi:hypothetical protein